MAVVISVIQEFVDPVAEPIAQTKGQFIQTNASPHGWVSPS